MRISVTVAALIVLSFPLTTISQQAPALSEAATTTAASDPARVSDNTQDSAITFFREGHFAGAALKPSVFLDDKELDRLSNGSWFSVHTAPGKHEIKSSAKNEPATVIETKPGETIYVQMIVVSGTWRGAGRLLQVDPADAQKVIAKLKALHGNP